MKIHSIILLVLIVLGFAATGELFSQGRARGGGKGTQGCCGPNTTFNRMYDRSTVESISGEIVGIDTLASFRGMWNGIHLTVKTEKGDLPVHLGPAWYLEGKNLNLSLHDKIDLRGSRVTIDEKPVLIAADITAGEKTVSLRNANGVPLWSGPGGSRGQHGRR